RNGGFHERRIAAAFCGTIGAESSCAAGGRHLRALALGCNGLLHVPKAESLFLRLFLRFSRWRSRRGVLPNRDGIERCHLVFHVRFEARLDEGTAGSGCALLADLVDSLLRLWMRGEQSVPLPLILVALVEAFQKVAKRHGLVAGFLCEVDTNF